MVTSGILHAIKLRLLAGPLMDAERISIASDVCGRTHHRPIAQGQRKVRRGEDRDLVRIGVTSIGGDMETNVVVLWAGSVVVKLLLATGMAGCSAIFSLVEVTVGTMDATDMP